MRLELRARNEEAARSRSSPDVQSAESLRSRLLRPNCRHSCSALKRIDDVLPDASAVSKLKLSVSTRICASNKITSIRRVHPTRTWIFSPVCRVPCTSLSILQLSYSTIRPACIGIGVAACLFSRNSPHTNNKPDRTGIRAEYIFRRSFRKSQTSGIASVDHR